MVFAQGWYFHVGIVQIGCTRKQMVSTLARYRPCWTIESTPCRFSLPTDLPLHCIHPPCITMSALCILLFVCSSLCKNYTDWDYHTIRIRFNRETKLYGCLKANVRIIYGQKIHSCKNVIETWNRVTYEYTYKYLTYKGNNFRK